MSRTHGTASCYVHGKCRCHECRTANAARSRSILAARRDPSTPLEYCPVCDEFFVSVINHERVHA